MQTKVAVIQVTTTRKILSFFFFFLTGYVATGVIGICLSIPAGMLERGCKRQENKEWKLLPPPSGLISPPTTPFYCEGSKQCLTHCLLNKMHEF